MFGSLFKTLAMIGRMMREFVTRQVSRLWANVRRATSLTTQAAKVMPEALSTVAAAGSTPTQRSDYVETRRLFIAKKVILIWIVLLLAALVLGYFVAWPWIVSKFLVCRMQETDSRAAEYNGRVELYYDQELTELKFRGRLEEGKAAGGGELYRRDGLPIYKGEYAEGKYHGDGKLYDDYGALCYDGQFQEGKQSGQGREYKYDQLVYEGGFQEGARSGKGLEYSDDKIIFEGEFKDGVREGQGQEYNPDGALIFSGEYKAGQREGQGVEYYPEGKAKYKGMFEQGLYHGEGELYLEDGAVYYAGSFSEGELEGEGSMYLSRDEWKSGLFSGGSIYGDMTWFRERTLYYEGQASASIAQGHGTLYNQMGKPVFTGAFYDGEIDAKALLGVSAPDIRTSFGEADYAETIAEYHFVIDNPEAKISVHCSYATDSEEAAVRRVYRINEDGSYVLAAEQAGYVLTSREGEAETILIPATGPEPGSEGSQEQTGEFAPATTGDMAKYLELEENMVALAAAKDTGIALEKKLKLREKQLEKMNQAKATGQSDGKDAADMQAQVDKINAELKKAQLAMERATKAIIQATGMNEEGLESQDLGEAYQDMAPADIDMSALMDPMVNRLMQDYAAQMIYKSREELELEAEDKLYGIELLYMDLQLAQADFDKLESEHGALYDEFGTGRITYDQYCDSMCAYYDAQIGLYGAMEAYSKELYRFNGDAERTLFSESAASELYRLGKEAQDSEEE